MQDRSNGRRSVPCGVPIGSRAWRGGEEELRVSSECTCADLFSDEHFVVIAMSLTKKYEALIELFNEIKDEIEERDPNEYARWKAGGFILDTNIISMYPNLDEVVEGLGDSEDDEEEEED